jgi:hypothetical protein
MKYPNIFAFAVLFFLAQVTFAQYYDTGQDPAYLKWMQIKTDRFTVIYPKTYASEGIAFARSLDEAYLKVRTLYPDTKIKIPVVIHSYTSQSNGYVAWAPRRIELYPTPEQNAIPLDTKELLTIHELTHVFQMQSLNKGFSKALSFVLGEQLTGITAALLPMWFLEGNAVFAESVLTESGRGRTPSFQKQLKSISIEKGRMYNYDRILNGSYKYNIPDQYESGYQIVSWTMAKYDPLIWNRVLDYTAKQPFTLSPVNISLRKSTGLNKRKLFTQTFDTLTTLWTNEVSENNTLRYEALNPDKKGEYINYSSPVFAGADSIIAIKSTLSEPNEFVLINPSGKTEKKIHTPGQLYPSFISYGNKKLVWVETQSDPRWKNRNYSVIRLLDFNNNTIKKLSRKSRYMAASISPDGRKIAAVENTTGNINNLVLIDSETGSVLQSIPAPGNCYLQRPGWAEGGKKITFISLTKEGEGIISYSLSDQKWYILVETGRDDLQASYLKNDSLYFISSLSGTDNIYLKTPDGKVAEITRSRFGVTDISFKGEELVFSDHNSLGNDICTAALPETAENIKEKISSSSYLIDRFNIKPESSDDLQHSVYNPEPYRKWQHLFSFHSWMPFYADLEEIQSDPLSIRPGITLMTQNQLSTLISSVGYEYSQEKKHVFHSQITWKGWYPIIESQLDYGDDPLIYNTGAGGETRNNPVQISTGVRFTNTISLPLSFNSGRFNQYIRPSITSEYKNSYIFKSDAGKYDYGQTILSGRLFFSNSYRYALRDIYPKWAQTLDLNWASAPFNKGLYGSVRTMKMSLYFPGFLPDNGIKICYEKEKQSDATFLFSNRISMPRGYSGLFSKEADFISVDYVMPLVYPDFNISSLLYLKRIRAGLFYDWVSGPGNSFYESGTNGFAQLTSSSVNEFLKSFGLVLLADFHVLRIPYMISGGIQTAWKDPGKMPSFELLFTIDIYGMTIGRR